VRISENPGWDLLTFSARMLGWKCKRTRYPLTSLDRTKRNSQGGESGKPTEGKSMKVRKKKDPVLWSLLANEDLASWKAARDYLLENDREEKLKDLELQINCLEFVLALQERFKHGSYEKPMPTINGREVLSRRAHSGETRWLKIKYKNYLIDVRNKEVAEGPGHYISFFGVQPYALSYPKTGHIGNLAKKFAWKIKEIQKLEEKDYERAKRRLEELKENI
jgi:hypothetical protein